MMRAGFLGVVLSAAFGCGGSNPPAKLERFTDASRGISIDIPSDWQRVDSEKLKFPKFQGPAIDGSRTTLVLIDDPSSGSLQAYSVSAIKALKAQHSSYFELSRAPFSTHEGASGLCVVIEGNPAGQIVVQRCYMFECGAKKVTAIFTRSGTPSERLDNVFDELAQTIHSTEK